MAINTLDEKFSHEVGDVYDAEHQFLQAQREMVQQATDATLKATIKQHIEQTQGQIETLEQVFSLLKQKPKREKCRAAAGIVAEGKKTMGEAGNEYIRDLLINGAMSKVEHYEIASYRGLIAGAELMGQDEIAQLLRQNLEQEEQTAQKAEKATPLLLQKALRSQSVGG